MKDMNPWYRGFNGNIIKLAEQKYIILGRYSHIGKNVIRILELPVGAKNCKSFTDYTEFIVKLMEEDSLSKKKNKSGETRSRSRGYSGNMITDYEKVKENDTEYVYDITFKDGIIDREIALNDSKPYNFEKKMHLGCLLSTTNMHAFDRHGKLKKYDTPLDIIDDFYEVRLEYYLKRRDHIINNLTHLKNKINAKYRFVVEIIDEKINIYRKKKDQIVEILENSDPPYPQYSAKFDSKADPDYEYLLSMRIDNFSEEKIEKLKKNLDELSESLVNIESKTYKQMWLEDIDKIEEQYQKDTEEWNDINGFVKRKSFSAKRKIIPRKKISIKRNQKS